MSLDIMKEIDREELVKFRLSSIVFDDLEVNTLKNLNLGSVDRGFVRLQGFDNYYLMMGLSDNYILMIYKIPDEWFVLSAQSKQSPRNLRHYKCDQMEGLIKLIKYLYDKEVR